MTTVLIVIHLMVVLAMIGLVLLQRSEGGALGIGGGGNFLSGRGAGNVLTRSTGILAAVFFATSIGLALLARIDAGPSGILDRLPGQTAPATADTQVPEPPLGAPTSAQDVLEALGGASAGPQTPPAAEVDEVPQNPDAGAAPAPAQTPSAPAQTPTAPAAQAPAQAPAVPAGQ